MKQNEILQQTVSTIKEGCYFTLNGITTIKTLTGIIILSYSDTKITLYNPFFDEKICDHVSQYKHVEYNIKDLTKEHLSDILVLFKRRLNNSINKYKHYLSCSVL